MVLSGTEKPCCMEASCREPVLSVVSLIVMMSGANVILQDQAEY